MLILYTFVINYLHHLTKKGQSLVMCNYNLFQKINQSLASLFSKLIGYITACMLRYYLIYINYLNIIQFSVRKYFTMFSQGDN